MTATAIYHVCRAEEWASAERAGRYDGSSQDQADGFIHFSSAAQVKESCAKHRAGQDGLVLLKVDGTKLGSSLKWEPSRLGELFPHLYGTLNPSAVISARPLPLGPDGQHKFPDPL